MNHSLEHAIPALTYRLATMDDAVALITLRNDPLVRQNSRNQDKVEWDEHVAWLERKHQTILICYYIHETVGIVRCDQGELSWSIVQRMRRRKLSRHMVKMSLPLFPPGPKWAEIKIDNFPSKKVAEYIGLQLTETRDGYEVWRSREDFGDLDARQRDAAE